MDLQTSLLCLVLVLLSGAILLFISIYGIKEKTYEEAIAEQRKMPDGALLLRKPRKEKTKMKKEKRQGKKVKEKSSNSKVVSSKKNVKRQPVPAPSSSSTAVPTATTTDNLKAEKRKTEHPHVNFVTPESALLNGTSSPGPTTETKKKKDKIKPILINKQESVVREKRAKNDMTVNHFAEIVPKDDLQLKLNTGKNNNTAIKKSNKEASSKDSQVVQKVSKGREKATNVQSETNHKTEKENDGKMASAETETRKEKGKGEKANVEKPKEEKSKSDKSKETKTKLEKVKDEKGMNNDRIKNEKVKSEEQKIQQQEQPQQHKNQGEQKAVRSEVNGSVGNSVVERVPVQMKKITNSQQQQINNKELKSKKHKNHEIFSLQQMVERDTININLLLPLIRKAELSRSEVQMLTDILLTSHSDEKTDRFEWIEGRQDPVAKLKKQLAEKEKALADEQQACQAFQNKLKELRSEYNSERARLSQACRQYDETVLAKQSEIQNLHATNRHLMDTHVAEKQALTQKIQQLQAQIGEENMMIRKLQEDHNQTQNALQQELVNQGQQMEMHIGRLSEQLQEAQKNYEAQIHNKMQEAEQLRASFNAELQKNRRYEEELRDLREQQVQSQNKVKSLESRASQLKESSNHTQELLRQIEELQRANKELEIRYNSSYKSEEELKFEKTKLQNEAHTFRNKIVELQNELENVQKECDKLEKGREKMKAAKTDLENDFARVKEENQCLISQVSSFTKIEREAQRLREENESLAAQVTAFTERPAGDGRENGDSPYNEDKNEKVNAAFINHENNKETDVVIEKLTGELKQKEILLEKLNSKVEGCDAEMARLSSDAAKYKTEIEKLKHELEAQKDKNNDLRKKNWKAMEALATTEKILEQSQKETEKSIQSRLKQCQESSRKLLERMFPSVEVKEKAYEEWLVEFEKNATTYLEQLVGEKENGQVEELETKNNQLQASIVYYKTIIEDTEGMLKKLQNHVEQEEIRWRQQCESLEVQIQVLKEKLAAVENGNDKVLERDEVTHSNPRTTEEVGEKCRNLTEEVENLKAKLQEEENKNNDLNNEVIKLRGTVKFRQDAYVEENKKRLELEDELKLLKSENIRDLPINSSGDFVAFEKGGFDRQ